LSVRSDERRIHRRGRPDGALDAALASVGIGTDDDPTVPLVHVLPVVDALPEVTAALVAWAADARSATVAGTDVVTLVDAEGFDTDHLARSMLAHGAVAATRALAMERARDGGRANLVVVDPDVDAADAAATIGWLLGAASVTAEIVTLGAARHGRQPA
jgi:hypothetical protein